MRIPSEVRNAVAKTEGIRKNTLYRMSKAKLGKNQAVGFYYGTAIEESDLFHKEEHIKVLPVKMLYKGSDDKKISSKYAIAFNVNNIQLDSVVEVKVPKGKIGIFAGKKGWQIKEWCKQLGLRRINLIEEA